MLYFFNPVEGTNIIKRLLVCRKKDDEIEEDNRSPDEEGENHVELKDELSDEQSI